MTQTRPERLHVYKNVMIDGARWDQFSPRDDDIFVCTTSKSGTTWMQAICALLIFGRDDPQVKPAVISPWFDMTRQPVEETLAMLEAQSHRRFIKTHTPLDGIPYFEHCSYLVVYRDPRDIYFSMRNHAGNMKSEAFIERATVDVHEGFQDWMSTPTTPDDYDGQSLDGIIQHFKSYSKFAALANLHLLHYADLKRDLPGAMARIAGILGIGHDAPTMATLAQAAGFEQMRRNADRFAPGAGTGVWKDEQRFFNKGESAQWRDVLHAEELADYDARIGKVLGADEAAWLHSGDAAGEALP